MILGKLRGQFLGFLHRAVDKQYEYVALGGAERRCDRGECGGGRLEFQFVASKLLVERIA